MAEYREVSQVAKLQAAACQICDVEKPSLFCNLCKQSMCDSCKEKHDVIRSFDKHSITPLCEKHEKPLTYICHTCVVGMCIKCILSDHIGHDHGKEFDTFSEGVENLRKKSKELEVKVQDNRKKIQEELAHVDAKLEETKNVKAALKKLRAVYVDKISKVDNLFNDIEEKCESKGENKRKSLQTMIEQSDTLRLDLNTDPKSDQKVIAEYTSNDFQIQDLLQKSMNILAEKFPGLELEKIGDEYSTCLQEAGIVVAHPGIETEDSVNITTKEPKQLLHYIGTGAYKLKQPIHVRVLSSDSVIVSDFELKQSFSICTDGKLMRTFKPFDKSKGGVRSALVQDKYCYIMQEMAVTKVCLENPEDVSSKIHGLPSVQDFCVARQNSFFVLSFSEFAIFQYNFDTNTSTKVVQTGGQPWFITRTINSSYLVSFPSENCVQEYDDKWTLIRTIGSAGHGDGQLWNPRGITTTPSGHILVADWDNHRVTCFNTDGSFAKHILTEKEGVTEPYAIAFKSPFLSVTEYKFHSLACLKCFKFQ